MVGRTRVLESLKLRVPNIREDGEALSLELGDAELRYLLTSADPEYSAVGEGGRVDLTLTRVRDNVFVKGRLKAVVGFRCVRCLADGRIEPDIELRWTFLPVSAYVRPGETDEDVELGAEDLEVSFYEGDQIDLEEVLRESLALELPSFPACRDECEQSASWGDDAAARPTTEGESAQNGSDDELDPRWSPLVELKRKLQS